MRFRVLLAVILGALAAIVGLFVLKKSVSQTDQPSNSVEAGSSTANATNSPYTAKPRDALPVETNTSVSPSVSMATQGKSSDAVFTPKASQTWATPAEKAAYIKSTVHKLDALGLENDPVSFGAIVSQFTNSIPVIRKAARDAAVQFGSRDAIPKLKEAAAAVEDPREKVEFLDAADFLELPTARERAAAPKTNAPVLIAPSHQNRPVKQSQSTPVPTEP